MAFGMPLKEIERKATEIGTVAAVTDAAFIVSSEVANIPQLQPWRIANNVDLGMFPEPMRRLQRYVEQLSSMSATENDA